MSRCREDTITVEQRPATVEDNWNSRNIAQRHKVAKLKNVCSQYGNFTAGQRTEYLRMISSIIFMLLIVIHMVLCCSKVKT